MSPSAGGPTAPFFRLRKTWQMHLTTSETRFSLGHYCFQVELRSVCTSLSRVCGTGVSQSISHLLGQEAHRWPAASRIALGKTTERTLDSRGPVTCSNAGGVPLSVFSALGHIYALCECFVPGTRDDVPVCESNRGALRLPCTGHQHIAAGLIDRLTCTVHILGHTVLMWF